MRRIRLRKKHIFKHKLRFTDKIILVIILLFISIYISLRFIGHNITPALLNYAEIETNKFVNAIINKAVLESKIDNIDSLFILSKTEDEIRTIDFNINIVNEMLTKISVKIQDSIKSMDNGQLLDIPGYDNEKLKKGIIYEIPSGLLLKNNLLSNLGPKIPVKLSMRGNISSNIDSSVTNYGINNALIKVNINLTIDEQVVLPFTVKKVQVNNSVPVIMKLIEGTVPKYYSGGINESSPILSIPLEEK